MVIGAGHFGTQAPSCLAYVVCIRHWAHPWRAAVQAKPMMTKSTVVDNETGKSVDSQVRTSTGTFFARGQDEVIAAVEKRLSLVR